LAERDGFQYFKSRHCTSTLPIVNIACRQETAMSRLGLNLKSIQSLSDGTVRGVMFSIGIEREAWMRRRTWA
jgi:hypothetical protein